MDGYSRTDNQSSWDLPYTRSPALDSGSSGTNDRHFMQGLYRSRTIRVPRARADLDPS